MEEITIKVRDQFSEFPGLRLHKESPNVSGEDFYHKILNEKFYDAFKSNKHLVVDLDETAGYLGECALVPYDSPIRNSEITFFNTLFDENACCHLALGAGFNNCLKDYEKYTLEECKEKGINDSMIHVDFMIGSEDLSIDAVTRDGKSVAIFRDGNWAF